MNNIESIRQFKEQARKEWNDQNPNQAINFIRKRLGTTQVDQVVEDSDDYETRSQLVDDLKSATKELRDDLDESDQDPQAVERTTELLDVYQDNLDDVQRDSILIRNTATNGSIASEPITFDDLFNIIEVAWRPKYSTKDLHEIQHRISDLYDTGKINAAMQFLQDCYGKYYVDDCFSTDYIDKATASYLLYEDINDNHTLDSVRHLCAKKLHMVETYSPNMYFKCDNLIELSTIDRQAMINAPLSLQKSFLAYTN